MNAPRKTTFSMPGMTYTPVEIGTLRIGTIDDTDTQRRPVKLDHFMVTTLVRGEAGWGVHPLSQDLIRRQHERDAQLSRKRGVPHSTSLAETKLRSIPIRVEFNDPGLTLESRYEAFDLKSQRPVCASVNPGEAIRAQGAELVMKPCAGSDHCEFAKSEGINCKYFARLHVQIEGQEQVDNGFILRTTSLNTIRTLESKLHRYHALFNGNLVGVPFRLHLRARTTSLSDWSSFYFLDLTLDDGISPEQAAALGRDEAERRARSGLNYLALEEVAREGRMHGRLSRDPLEGALMEEFFMPVRPGLASAVPAVVPGTTIEAPARAAGVHVQGFSLIAGAPVPPQQALSS